MKNIKELVENVENSIIVQNFLLEHSDAYLVHIFKMFNKEDEWQIGYYSRDIDNVHTFVLNSGTINQNPGAEAFKEPGKTIKPLNIDNVNISPDKASEIAESNMKEKYGSETAKTKIMILQNIDNLDMYNFTYITSSFKTVNIKINASSGDILASKIFSLMDFAQK